MGSSQDTEITLGTGKLLVLFFGLVGACALFFALGYSLGRKSEPSFATASNAGMPRVSTDSSKAGSASAPQRMTFYKSVEQKDANPELTPAADPKSDTGAAATAGKAGQNNGIDPATAMPTSGYFVQVAAVSKQDDADALVDALKKKEYPAFVTSSGPTDKLFHVQLGPYSDAKDAEGIRTKLIGDGYSPILKK
jgi:cell division septation protein DedD